ncbi:MAG: type II toxin-antitoxin system VapC family toxin [Lentisphaerae bacterium]|nr:type II toxin-antitoxin system VapC family toxin [Lentisphaerota bacterium]
MRACLDTNAYSRLMGGHVPLTELLESCEEVLLPATVLGELHAGFERGSRREANRRQLAEFLALPGVGTIPVTADIAERYGVLVRDLTRQGNPIPTNDIWIAAAALETGTRLVTYDPHFERVHGLIVLSP